MSSTPILHLNEVPEPHALFFRPAPQDHLVLVQVLSEGDFPFSGVILDPCFEDSQKELRDELAARGLWSILDPKSLEMSFSGGATARRVGLPWATGQLQTPADFSDYEIDRSSQILADHAASYGYSAVFAPTHFLEEGPQDDWLKIDGKLSMALRKRLNSNGLTETPIFYPLAMKMASFRSEVDRARYKDHLSRLPIDSLWLRINGFGSESGGVSLVHYIQACRNLHSLRLPIIPEKTGSLGLALLAFRAVSGIECGVSTGEKFDVTSLKAPPLESRRGGTAARVYLQPLNSFITREQAGRLFEIRGMRRYGCEDTACCKNGTADMINGNRRRHFVHTRIKEVEILATPLSLRTPRYLDKILRPATDQLARIQGFKGVPEDLKKRFEDSRKRHFGWLHTLTNPALHRFTREEVAEFPRRIKGFDKAISAK